MLLRSIPPTVAVSPAHCCLPRPLLPPPPLLSPPPLLHLPRCCTLPRCCLPPSLLLSPDRGWSPLPPLARLTADESPSAADPPDRHCFPSAAALLPTAHASGSPPPTASGGVRQRRGRRSGAAAAVDCAGSGQGRGLRPAAGEVAGSVGCRQVRRLRRGAVAMAGSASGHQVRGDPPQSGSVAGRPGGCRQQECRLALRRWLAEGDAPAVRATASGVANSSGGDVSDRSERAKTTATEGKAGDSQEGGRRRLVGRRLRPAAMASASS